jgi:hypothetical protein
LCQEYREKIASENLTIEWVNMGDFFDGRDGIWDCIAECDIRSFFVRGSPGAGGKPFNVRPRSEKNLGNYNNISRMGYLLCMFHGKNSHFGFGEKNEKQYCFLLQCLKICWTLQTTTQKWKGEK